MRIVTNPFITSGYISEQYFCDRVAESALLLKMLTNGNNTAIISPRRMGKTGLIKHCFHFEEINEHYHCIFIDIYATNNLKEFVYALGKEIFESLKPRGRKIIDNFFSIISSLRPAFKLDINTGEPTFDIGFGEIHTPAFTLDEIFSYLESADMPCIIAIYEFQQIAKYPENNIEAILRTHIQHCKNSQFIFAGSQRHLMENIFFSSSRPFYQSVSLLELKAIDEIEYTNFAIKHFSNAQKTISSELIRQIYQLFEGHTWYMQHVLNELFSITEKGETCTLELVRAAVSNKIESYKPLYQSTLTLLSERQKEALFAIAKERNATQINSGSFIKRHGLLSASSVQTAVRQLLEKEIVTTNNNAYQVYDRFFGLWLTTVFSIGYKVG